MADEDNQSTAPQSHKKDKTKYLWIVIAVLVILLIAGAAFVFGSNNSTARQIRAYIIKPVPTATPETIYEPTEEPIPTEVEEPTEEPEPTEEVEPTDTPTQAPSSPTPSPTI